MYFGLRGNTLLVGITASSGMGFVLFGYDNGLMGGLLSSPDFINQFDDMSPTLQGAVTGLFEVGASIGCIISSLLGDRYGRKTVIHLGSFVLSIGAIIQSCSYSRAQLIVGRIVAGIGLGIITSRLSIWQSETAPPKIRGTVIACSLSFLIVGSIIAYWLEYGLNYTTGSITWRFPMAFQILFAILISLMLLHMPESPRWLAGHGYSDETRHVFAALLGKDIDSDEVSLQMERIQKAISVEEDSQMSWHQMLAKDDVGTRKRLLVAFLAQFLQPFSGSTTVNYYATTIYENSVHMSRHMALLMSGFTMIWFLLMSLFTWWFLEKLGRRFMFISTACAMTVVLAVFAAMVKVDTTASGIVATVFLFAYETFYTWGWMGNCWTYPSEILPLGARSKGMSVSVAAQYMMSFVILQVTPPGLQNIGWKMYIVYAVFNLAFVPIVYFLFPETAGCTLEEVDNIYLDPRHSPIKVSMEMWKKRRSNEPEQYVNEQQITTPSSKESC